MLWFFCLLVYANDELITQLAPRLHYNGGFGDLADAETTTQGTPPVDGQIQMVAIPDTNGDGIDDFTITYPDGLQQVLYYQGIQE